MMRKLYVPSLLALLITFLVIVPVFASPPTTSMHPDTAQKMLIDGNNRFMQEKDTNRQIGKAKRTELTNGQHPFAVVVSCSDSRVPPELIFDQGLGDIFVVRVAGNILDAIGLGSVEYAVEHLGVKLIVVLGHENCGAVKATVDGGDISPNIQAIAAKIQPAVIQAEAGKPANIYEAATDVNITNVVAILKADPVIASFAGVKIVGAKYHLDSGAVVFRESL